VARRIVAYECLDEREHALGCTHAGESRHPLEQLRHAREATSGEKCGPRVGHRDGLVPACLVALEVGPLDDDARNVEQRFSERSAVDARRSFFGQYLQRGDEPRLRKQIAVTEERAAGRVERSPAVERHHRLEHGEALRVGRRERHALASEPPRRLDEPPPGQAAVLSPECVERSGKTRDGARRRPDGVGDRLLAELDFEVDELSTARGDSGEAVEVPRLSTIPDDRVRPAEQAGHDRLRHARRKGSRDRRVGGRPALGEDLDPGCGCCGMSSCDGSSHRPES
jgi:hypothetical protein